MSETQRELSIEVGEPEIAAEDIERLVGVLSRWETARTPAQEGDRPRAPGWLTAAELGAQIDASDRFVRKVASAACPAVVSYPGSPGYKLWQLCTIEEIAHCIEAFESQGKDMFQRAILYRQAYHRRFRGAPEAREEARRA